MQPNYRASLLNSNSNCLTGFLIVVTWQTLIIALLSWTPRHCWLPISKLNLILWTFFLPLTVTIMAAPAAITIFPMCMEALKNQAHFNVPANRFYR
jgi:hypothetical protein